MSTVTSILASDIVSSSRGTINVNFQNLNTDKLEAATVAQTLSSTLSTVAITPSILGETQKMLWLTPSVQTTTSVLASVPRLTWNVGVNQNWVFTGELRYVADATSDLKWTFTAPEGTIGGHGNPETAAGDVVAFGTTKTVNGNDVALGEIQMVSGYATIGSVAGSVALAWGRNVQNDSSTISLLELSNIRATRLS